MFVSSGFFFRMIFRASAFDTNLTDFTSDMFDGLIRLPIFSFCAAVASSPHESWVQK